MPWSVAAAAVGAIGANAAASKNAKAAKAAAGNQQGASADYTQQSWEDIERTNELNRQNALWAQQQNLVNTTTDFGSTEYTTDPVTGKISAKQSLTPEQQKMLESLRGQQSTAIGGMESGFNVNNDVMQAMRAQSAPLMEQQRNKENARLAAMGLATGSGSAWGTAQDALNRSDNDMEQKNILGGFDAWQQEQANNRANLGSLNSTESSWAGLAPKASWSQVAAPNVLAPKNMTWEAAQNEMAYNTAAQNSQANGMGQIGSIVGGLVGNKDVQNTVGGWFKPSTGTGMNDWGYSGGSIGQNTPSTGFDW